MAYFEKLSEYFFELSNEDRLEILKLLSSKPSTLTRLSEELNIRNQQCSRHLARLSTHGFVTKDPDGNYILTSFGELALTLVNGPLFAVTHRDYFMNHLISVLPDEFLLRIGELEKMKCVDDVMVVFRNIENMFMKAEKETFRITDRYMMIIVKESLSALKRGISLKIITPKVMEYPPDVEQLSTFEEHWRNKLHETREIDNVNVFLAMSEKEVAALAFPTLDGKFDYRGFSSEDPESLKWCRDLFEHYWCTAGQKEELIWK
jgi:predicted transcriptional regulator